MGFSVATNRCELFIPCSGSMGEGTSYLCVQIVSCFPVARQNASPIGKDQGLATSQKIEGSFAATSRRSCPIAHKLSFQAMRVSHWVTRERVLG